MGHAGAIITGRGGQGGRKGEGAEGGRGSHSPLPRGHGRHHEAGLGRVAAHPARLSEDVNAEATQPGKNGDSNQRLWRAGARWSTTPPSFYAGRLYSELQPEKNVPYREYPLPSDVVNRIFCKSSESMDELPDCSVHLMVTSPPYNVGKEYDEDLTLEEYLSLLKRVMADVHRVLVPGGRACINVATWGRRPYIPVHAYIIQDMLDLGLPDARRGHLEQVHKRQPLHGVGKLDVRGQSYPQRHT